LTIKIIFIIGPALNFDSRHASEETPKIKLKKQTNQVRLPNSI